MSIIYSHTQSLCNVCQKKIQARILGKEDQVYLEKFCHEHGSQEVVISSDQKWYEESIRYLKPSEEPLKRNVSEFKGCPDSCGLCPEHQQHTCLPIIEINGVCDLDCPICLKKREVMPDLAFSDYQNIMRTLLESERNLSVVNLSGGEPTLHPELMDFIRYTYEAGVNQVSVSTNGLSLLKNPELRQFFKETNTIVALQFDGFSSETYQRFRGVDLFPDKMKLIEILEVESVPYSLVCTLANGVNLDQVPRIVDFFFESKALSLMFQPLAISGQALNHESESYRLTVPDVIKGIGESSFARFEDFNPLPCSHYSCFALAYYLKAGEGEFVSLKNFLGLDTYLDVIANKTLPGLDQEGYGKMKEKIYELWSAADSCDMNERLLKRIKRILLEMQESGFNTRKALNLGLENMKAIFIHDFMDIYNFDFGRLMKCCNPYPQRDGRLIPMCAQNVIFQEKKEG